MKRHIKQTLNGMLLLVAMSPGLVFADSSNSDIVQAIKDMNTNLGGILNNQVGDVTRTQLAAALINYEAAARVQDFQYNQQLLFMQAPGAPWALAAGSVVGASNTATAALQLSNAALVASVGALSTATTVTLHGQQFNTPNSQGSVSGPSGFYQKMAGFVTSGDPTSLTAINAAAILQTDNLTKAGMSTTDAQNFITAITNPFPIYNPILITNIKNNTLQGTDIEALGTQLAEYAVIGISSSALADIAARRLPAAGQTASVMDVMDTYSSQRFSGPNSQAWANFVGAASDTALLREIAHMMAFNTWMQYQQFRVSEQQLALQASMNAVLGKLNVYLDQINAAMVLAKQQAAAAGGG
ncbi:MAG: hypothetical protein ACHQJ6_07555 [Candidatus Berkiellales bacterium]